MRFLSLILCLAFLQASSQSIDDCRQRLTRYLDFNGSLSGQVLFETKRITIHFPSQRQALVVNEYDLALLSGFFKQSSPAQQAAVINAMWSGKWNKRQSDSLFETLKPRSAAPVKESLPLAGRRIAIDPGHFGTSLSEAAVEQKHLHFTTQYNGQTDSVKIYESHLTFVTALLLKKKLEQQGAEVMLTRQQETFTSFGCNFEQWIKNHRRRVLDSLLKEGDMTPARHAKLIKCSRHAFFWDFFRDYELLNRVALINKFAPDVAVIIHYNVDEKNTPWKKASPKNFTMTFMGGALTSADLSKKGTQMDFLRLLFTDQLNRSEQLCSNTVNAFHSTLQIPIAKSADAEYLLKNCKSTGRPGVFCRNLALCRRINAPLVYGEALYQDNEKECQLLMDEKTGDDGILLSGRISSVTSCYYSAILKYFENN